MESILMRVSVEFKKWCDEMIQEKKQTTNDKNEYLSGQRITKLIPRHLNSQEIREDILNFSWGKE